MNWSYRTESAADRAVDRLNTLDNDPISAWDVGYDPGRQPAPWIAYNAGEELALARGADLGGLSLTTAEVSAQLGVSRQRVRQLAVSRQVGRKLGRDWLFRSEDVELMRDRRPGRPPNGDPEPLEIATEDEVAAMNSVLHCGFVDQWDTWDTEDAWADPSVRREARAILERYRADGSLPDEDARRRLATCCN